MPYAHCEACRKSQYDCLCRATCTLCGIRTNHTTAQHEQAERIMCYSCQENVVKGEEEMCGECLSDMAQYYRPDEGGSE